jgi:hypothetical protein
MAGSVACRMVAGAIVLARLSGPVAAGEKLPAVAVHVFNYDGVAARLLGRAEADVTQLYRDAGVQVLWVDTVANTSTGRFVIHIIIGHSAPGNVMGTSLGLDHASSGTALVYRDRVLQVAHGRDALVPRVLAYAMAHEMGHLLLPYPAHAADGIMRANWNDEDLAHIAGGSLRFTSAEAKEMRDKISGCCATPAAGGSR